MDTETRPAGSAERARRVIKRYSNRKLYDTRDSRYVTLQQIGEMVRAGEEVQIIDNKTKEDKTEVTLALILSEDLRSQPRSVPLGALRDLIQERGGKLLSSLREGPIGRLIPGNTPAGAATTDAAAASEPSAEPAQNEEKTSKKTLGALVESSFSTIDERIRAMLPSLPTLSAFKELEAEVKRLTARVETLEAAKGPAAAPSKPKGPEKK